jgi:hypothetical protein
MVGITAVDLETVHGIKEAEDAGFSLNLSFGSNLDPKRSGSVFGGTGYDQDDASFGGTLFPGSLMGSPGLSGGNGESPLPPPSDTEDRDGEDQHEVSPSLYNLYGVTSAYGRGLTNLFD